MRISSLLSLLAAAGLVAAEGYKDTPLIPGTNCTCMIPTARSLLGPTPPS